MHLKFSRASSFGGSLNAVQRTFAFSLLILILLQVWRPYYFLTDDNMSYWLPIVADIGHRLGHGQSPFVNSYLFGGNYHLLADPNNLFYWNPLVMGLALLANTRAYLLIVDLCASTHLLLGSVLFAYLLSRLRQLHNLPLSDGRIAFLSLSYTFSSYALAVGPSWVVFLANQVALTIIMLGLIHERKSKAIVLVALGILYALLMGHASPFLFTMLFVFFCVVGLSFINKSSEPFFRLINGLCAALVIASPFLLPAVLGFRVSPRSGSFSPEDASMHAVDLPTFIGSYFGGYFGVLACAVAGLHTMQSLQTFPGCAASWTLLQGFDWKRIGQAKQSAAENRTKLSSFRLLIGVLTLLVVLFVVRPYWLAVIISHVPLYRSLRWPFREIFIFLFFVHLWVALRPVQMSARASVITSLAGAVLFLFSLVLTPWSFAPMTVDRSLLISGQAQDYWKNIKASLKPGDQIIPIAKPNDLYQHFSEMPFTLIGAYNYPSLFEVRSASGYVGAGLANTTLAGIVPSHWSGTFNPEDGDRLLKKNPHFKALQLVSLHPLVIELRSAHSRRRVELPPLVSEPAPSP